MPKHERESGEMTAQDHQREAQRYLRAAEQWEGEGEGSIHEIGNYSRNLRRSVELQAAQVHATLMNALTGQDLITVLLAHAEAGS